MTDPTERLDTRKVDRARRNSPKRRLGRRLTIHKLGSRKFNVVPPTFILYELQKSGTRRIGGMERINILRQLFPEKETTRKTLAQKIGLK